jgi:STE24 endopeptidase
MDSEGWFEKTFELLAEGMLVWIGFSLILFILMWFGRKFGKRSWLLMAAIWSGYFVYSAHNSEIFHHRGMVISDGPPVEQIGKMAQSEGFPLTQIIFADPANSNGWHQAQVVGIYNPAILLGPGYRDRDLVGPHSTFNGTQLRSATDAMTVATVGHELAHIRQHHLFWGLAYTIFVAFLFCLVGYHAWSTLIKASAGKRFETELWSLSSMAMLVPIAIIAVNILPYARNPIILHFEREADSIGLDISKEADGMAALVVWMNTGTSLRYGKWMQWLVYSHPSGEERIRTAMEWKARNLKKLREAGRIEKPIRR